MPNKARAPRRLPPFRTQGEPNVYQRLPVGTAILDGYQQFTTQDLLPSVQAVIARYTRYSL